MMSLTNKKILVLGLGVTGISTIKALYKLGARIIVSDTKNEESLANVLKEISDIPIELHLNSNDIDLTMVDLVIKSPGIPPTSNLVKKAIENNIEVITDIELAYRISPTKNIIAITGTNGKTTCTVLTGEIFKNANYNTHVVGNVGVGILDKMLEATKDDIFVIEASSFQLEHTSSFKPKVSLITNITPDHINWHGSLENYIVSKLKILKNQDINDFIILNHDDKLLRQLKGEVNGKIIWFSVRDILSEGVYIENDFIVINDGVKKLVLMSSKDLKIIGKHNLENVLGCIGIAVAMNLDLDIVRESLINFQGVEHRIEFVVNKKGVSFYNDSKGTNPDASIKAIEAVKEPIILIAGGYDKKSSYDDFIKAFNKKVKALILFGQTKDIIKEAAMANGYNSVYLVNDLKEAISLAFSIAKEKDNVLLSPACASWDMYSNFEERGRDFKKIVFSLLE